MKKVVNLNAMEIVCAKCKQPVLVKVQVNSKSKQKVKTRNNPRRKGRIYND